MQRRQFLIGVFVHAAGFLPGVELPGKLFRHTDSVPRVVPVCAHPSPSLPLALHSHVATAEPVTSGVRARYATSPNIKDVVDTFLPLCAESQPTW